MYITSRARASERATCESLASAQDGGRTSSTDESTHETRAIPIGPLPPAPDRKLPSPLRCEAAQPGPAGCAHTPWNPTTRARR